MKLLFEFDPKKCSACGACAIACMDQNDIEIQEGQKPYRKVYQSEENGEFASISTACKHCSQAACIDACPRHCLYKDEESGLTLYDTSSCVGCHSCERACPFDAISFRKSSDNSGREKMEKCHGCLERIKDGRMPACLHSCPTGALTVTEVTN